MKKILMVLVALFASSVVMAAEIPTCKNEYVIDFKTSSFSGNELAHVTQVLDFEFSLAFEGSGVGFRPTALDEVNMYSPSFGDEYRGRAIRTLKIIPDADAWAKILLNQLVNLRPEAFTITCR